MGDQLTSIVAASVLIATLSCCEKPQEQYQEDPEQVVYQRQDNHIDIIRSILDDLKKSGLDCILGYEITDEYLRCETEEEKQKWTDLIYWDEIKDVYLVRRREGIKVYIQTIPHGRSHSLDEVEEISFFNEIENGIFYFRTRDEQQAEELKEAINGFKQDELRRQQAREEQQRLEEKGSLPFHILHLPGDGSEPIFY